MKKSLIIVLALVAIVSTNGYSQKLKPVKVSELKNLKDSVSYAFGSNIANSMKESNLDINIDILVRAISQIATGKEEAISKEGQQEVMERFGMMMQEKQMQEAKEKGMENRKAGEKFMAKNKKNAGVIETPSGLQYKIITQGMGEKPSETDVVEVKYRLSTIDGKEIESTFDRDEPVSFGLQHVIKGFTEGISLMSVGSRYMLWIPADLGYGDADMGAIAPGSTLCFEVQLDGISEPQETSMEEYPEEDAVMDIAAPAEE